MRLFIACVYTVSILAGFCVLWAYLEIAWDQLRI